MTRERFIELMDDLFSSMDMPAFCEEEYEDFAKFWESFKKEAAKNSGKEMTENGSKIYQFMIDNKEAFSNAFSAKQIGEGLFMSSRSVSGTMRKLISGGYVEKMGANPVIYCLVDKLEEE